MDNVNSPQHYTNCSLECIDVMMVTFGAKATFNFCLLNAFKYLWRYKNKNGTEDIDKAGWYLTKADKIFQSYDGADFTFFDFTTEDEKKLNSLTELWKQENNRKG